MDILSVIDAFDKNWDRALRLKCGVLCVLSVKAAFLRCEGSIKIGLRDLINDFIPQIQA